MCDALRPKITGDQLTALASCHDTQKVRELLLDVFAPTTERPEVVGDLYFYFYAFARDQKFTERKMATFLTICQQLFDADTSTNDPLETFERSYQRFEAMLLKHSVERPPWSAGIFDGNDVKAIVNFVLHDYFRHYRLYKAIFTARKDANFSVISPFETPHQVPPLATGVLRETEESS